MKLIMKIGKKFPDITGPISDAFAEELTRVAGQDDFNELILDFSGLKGINSLAMGTIFSVTQKLKQGGKSLLIINSPEKISRLLQMVNLGDVVV